jgi:very-short-patch-repair endonuclease
VEIDGWVHDKRKRYDKFRDEILRSKGYSIIRFKNEDVVGNLSRVCKDLEHALTLTLSRGVNFPDSTDTSDGKIA